MQTLSNTRNDVNSLAVESFVKSSRRLARVSYEFTPIPADIDLDPILEKLYRIFIKLWRRGIVDPCNRLLADLVGRCERSVRYYCRKLEKLGLLGVIQRRVTKNRNASNVYTLMGLEGGVGAKNCPEKKGEVLKTTTPAPERGAVDPPGPSTTALQWELRRVRDALDSLRMRGAYEDRGKSWVEMQQWRLHKAKERCRIAMNACIGMYNGPSTPVDEAEVEAYQQQEWERIEAIKAERERVRLEQDRMNREAHEERERRAIEAWPETLKTVEKLERMLRGAK
jgi:hypothetical protein